MSDKMMMLMTTARAEALFASALVTGSSPDRQEATNMINATVRRCRGVRGCAAEMAGAFGDYPEAAVRRMRWACEIALTLFKPAPPGRPAAREENRTCRGGRSASVASHGEQHLADRTAAASPGA